MEQFLKILDFIKDNSALSGTILIVVGVAAVILGFILVKFNFNKEISQVKEDISVGYESIINDYDSLIGDYSKSIEPVNFIFHNNSYIVLSKYFGVDTTEKSQIRIDSFNRKTGDWNRDFGTSGKGYRLLSTSGNNLVPVKILEIDNEKLLIVGLIHYGSHAESFITVVDNKGLTIESFNNGDLKIIEIKGKRLSWVNDAIIFNNNIYLLSNDIPEIGMGIVSLDMQGNINSSFGDNGVTKKLEESSFGSIYPKVMIHDKNTNSFYVAGQSGKGLIVKYKSNGEIDKNFVDSGVKDISDMLLHNGFVNQINDIKAMENGTTLTVGTANNGFVVAVNNQGTPNNYIGTSGRIDVRSFYKVESCCISIDSEERIYVGGMEYDGNSIMNGLISFFDKNGKPIKLNTRQSIHIENGRKNSVVDMLHDDNQLIVLTKDNSHDTSFSSFNLYKVKIEKD